MSLTVMAIRIAAVQALKSGVSLVDGNVLDSQISAIDHTADGQLTTEQQKPFIAVYTDSAKTTEMAQTGTRSNGRVEIVFNFGVALTMAQTDKATGAAIVAEGLPATDAHFEAVLDVIGVQIARALDSPDNPWAQVFRDFVQTSISKACMRSSSASQGVRLAAGQTKLLVDVFSDPILGQPLSLDGPWGRFMALMEAENLSQLALFRTLLGDEIVGNYADFERLCGMSSCDADGLQLYSFGGVPREVTLDEASSTVVG